MSQHEYERKILDDLLSRTIMAERFVPEPSDTLHQNGHIWHHAHTEKKRLDRQSGTEEQAQYRIQYRRCIVFVLEAAASLKRALPDGLELQSRLRGIRETIIDAIRALEKFEFARR